jgi:hypothetical protein
VTIGGQVYNGPGTIVDTTTGPNGCDLITTYILQYAGDPAATLTLTCSGNIAVDVPSGTTTATIDYDLPLSSGDCPCPGVELTRTAGLPSGSAFPEGTTQVCYLAKDSCGNTASCCFTVTVQGEDQACDVQEIGCMKYELLSITRNISTSYLTYRIRVTNKCASRMIHTAIQLPNGVVAKAPANNALYTAPGGRMYEVRNPNFSPFYSIRFKSTSAGIANGESDVFQYTLPPQVNPNYIHITSRIDPKTFYEAYLNTFKCPVELLAGQKPALQAATSAERQAPLPGDTGALAVYPNPTAGVLFADLSAWNGAQIRLCAWNSQGQKMFEQIFSADSTPQEIRLPEHLSSGFYLLEFGLPDGERRVARVVIQR